MTMSVTIRIRHASLPERPLPPTPRADRLPEQRQARVARRQGQCLAVTRARWNLVTNLNRVITKSLGVKVGRSVMTRFVVTLFN